MTVFSAQDDDDCTICVGGIADAVAYQPEGSVDLVIDWKTDVNLTTQQIDLYREQMRDYLIALARISQRDGCIGALDLRKSCCENGLSRRQGSPDADRV